eukprot:TRINITY_DN2178_c0_g1_i1.p1 TRINITY_DN2178_c0_g1~~TRINITY_DN2178_c0_g1_i1.p1  ORF type:complete len:838 (-),score=196.21 TRINITY_DN2178_c0_g1_i1:33-2546(-)
MSVRLYEKPVLPVADRFIGVVTIRLMNERIKYKKFDKWYPLAKLTQHQNVSGELRLDIDFRDPDLGDVKKRKKMKDRSISISGDVSPPEAKLPVDILTRGNTNPRSPSPSNTSNGDRSNRSNGSSGPSSPSSPSSKMSPTFARKTSFERRGGSSINDKRAARASVAVSKFQLDSYFKQPESNSTSEDNKTDTDTDNEIKPMKIGAFSVAQRGGGRRGRRSSEEVEEGYATTSAVSPRATRSPVPIVDPKRSRQSPDGAGKRTKVKRVSTLDVDIPEPKSPSGKKRAPATPVQETKVAPSSDSKAARRNRKEDDAAGVGYSTDYAGSSSTRTKKIKVSAAEPISTTSKATSAIVASPSSPTISKPKPSQTPFSDVEDSPSSKHRRRRKDVATADDTPKFHAPISEPIIVPIKNASPTKNRTPARTPTESPAGSRNGSPSKRGNGENVLVPLVVERHRGSDRSKRLSMQLGYATDAPPSRPRGSSAEKKKSSRKSSRDADSLPVATSSSSSASASAPVIMADTKPAESPRKKKRMYAKQDSPRAQHESPRSDGPDSPKPVKEEQPATPTPTMEPTVDVTVPVSVESPAEPAKEASSPAHVEAPVESAQEKLSTPNPEEQPLEKSPAEVPEPVSVSANSSLGQVESQKTEESKTSSGTEEPSTPKNEHASQHTPEEQPNETKDVETVESPASPRDSKAETEPAPVDPAMQQTPATSHSTTDLASDKPLETENSGSAEVTAPSDSAPSSGTETSSASTEIPIVSEPASPTTLSPSSSASNIASPGGSRSKIDRTSSIVENAASRTLSRQTSIKEVLNADDPLAKSQLMKNFFTGLGVTKKK